MKDWFGRLSLKKREWLCYAGIIAAVFAAYANVYGNAFLLDDMVLIVQNAFLRSWDTLPDLLTSLSLAGMHMEGGFFRPVQMLLFFLVYQAVGLSAPVFHGVNVVLQALCGCMVYRLGRKLGWPAMAAFSAALLWAIHPLHTEAVSCVSGSADALYTIFTLGGLLILLPRFTMWRIWGSCLFFALALLSKESAIVFPALACFTLFLVSKERLKLGTYVRTWPLWVLMTAYFIAWEVLPAHNVDFLMHDPGDIQYDMHYTHNVFNRILTSLATLPTYLGLILWPVHLHMERSYPVFTSFMEWRVQAGFFLGVLGLLQLVWSRGRRGLALSWGLLWFAAAFSPYTGIVKPINAFVAEHWMYLPGVGLSLGLSHAIAAWVEKKRAKSLRAFVTAGVAVAAVALGTVTYLQNRVWHDAESFYMNIFAAGETSGRAHNSLGQHYFNAGEYDKAEEQYRLAVEHPAPLWASKMSLTHMHLAFIYLGAQPNAEGRIALPEVQRVMRITPRLPQAIAELEKVVELDGESFWAHAYLGLIYEYKGDQAKAAYYKRRSEEILRTSDRDPDWL